MLRAILIDDEESSLSSLEQKIRNHCPEVSIIDTCNSAKAGLQSLESLHPDLLFLDIEMPIMNGFTLLQKLNYRSFQVIFVTAYDHYAIKAIKYSALDYLVKPVEVNELRTAVQRASRIKNDTPNRRLELLVDNILNERRKYKKIAINSPEGLRFIEIDTIKFLEASSNYTFLCLADEKKHLSSRSLKDFEEMLPADTFLRIHNSYIINKNYVERYIRGEGGTVVLEGNVMLDISKRRKADFLRSIGAG